MLNRKIYHLQSICDRTVAGVYELKNYFDPNKNVDKKVHIIVKLIYSSLRLKSKALFCTFKLRVRYYQRTLKIISFSSYVFTGHD